MLSSLVFLAYRSVLHDPEAYPDSYDFKPERYILPDGSIMDEPVLICAFGLGKRYVQKPSPALASLYQYELIICAT